MSAEASAAANTMSGHTAIVLGPTGAVGRHVLTELLASQKFSSVHAVIRSGSSLSAVVDAASAPNGKLVEHTVDFEKLLSEQSATSSGSTADAGTETEKLRSIGADAVLIALGTTRATAGGAKPFERIDREYVLAAARAAKVDRTQSVLYCSSQAASSTAPFLYPKSKGLTEEGLASLGYSETVIFRPGYLAGAQRGQRRLVEDIFGSIWHNTAARISDNAEIPTSVLGKAMVRAAKVGAAGLEGKFATKPTGKGWDALWKDSQPTGAVLAVGNAEAAKLAQSA